MPTETETLSRREAARLLSGLMQDRTHFHIAVSLAPFGGQVDTFIRHVPSWAAYLDFGQSDIIRTTCGRRLSFAARAFEGSAVLAIPKTVTSYALEAVFGVPVQGDGLRELLDLEYDHWPSLMHEALTLADPEQAAAAAAAYQGERPAFVSHDTLPGLLLPSENFGHESEK